MSAPVDVLKVMAAAREHMKASGSPRYAARVDAARDLVAEMIVTLEQISNLSKTEPVAWEYQNGETGLMAVLSNDGINNPDNFGKNNPGHVYIGPLYRSARIGDEQGAGMADYQRGFRSGYERRYLENQGALV